LRDDFMVMCMTLGALACTKLTARCPHARTVIAVATHREFCEADLEKFGEISEFCRTIL
jgi:hypothetical protein